jgi:hypothetical protein
MIKRIIILLEILFKMSNSLYMLSARIEVISFDTQSFYSHHVILPQFCFCIAVCDILEYDCQFVIAVVCVASRRYEHIISDSVINEWLGRTNDWNRIVDSTHLFCMRKSTSRQASKQRKLEYCSTYNLHTYRYSSVASFIISLTGYEFGCEE